MRTTVTTCLLVLIVLGACSDGGSAMNDYLERSVNVNGKTFRYRVYVSKNRQPDQRVPVMLYLHGSGSRGSENREQARAFDGAIGAVKDKVDFLVVLPQCADGTFWASSEMSNYALAALDAAVSEFNGDPDRLYLAGFSLGGYGVWHIAAAYPGKFAALMPVAGGVVGERPIEPRDRAVIIPSVGTMLDAPEPYKELAKAIGGTPVWVFHGDKDESVRVDFARTIVKALQDNGSKNVRYTEYAGEGHQIFDKAIAEPGFLDWLISQKNER